MKRRDFIQKAIWSGVGLACMPWAVNAQTSPYSGELLLVIECGGAWDTSLYIDPKENQPDELEITKWSRDATTQKQGNIAYAPIGNNETFFTKYADRSLIINGVDTQTNSHGTGVMHSSSGRNAQGYPSLPALFAAVKAPQLPFSYLRFGGYGYTSEIITATMASGGNQLKSIVGKGIWPWDGTNIRYPEEDQLIEQALERSYQAVKTQEALPRVLKSVQDFKKARDLSPSLDPLLDILPSEFIQESPPPLVKWSNAMSSIQLAFLSFKAGVASSATVQAAGGFDTHQNNDAQQYELLSYLNDTISYAWDYAEELGIADRLNVVVTSDFCRTPHYNSGDGKDHWPTNSYMVMKKGASWANRTVGATDHMQNPLKINPGTLQLDDSSAGIIMNPSHVHMALRDMLGLSGADLTARFPFLLTEPTSIFTSTESTV